MNELRQILYADAPLIAPLFDGWQETMIWSFLQRHLGVAWAYGEKQFPDAACICVSCFGFLAGNYNSPGAEILITTCAEREPDLFLTPQNEAWEKKIQQVFERRSDYTCQRIIRYAIQKEPHVFDRGKLENLAKTLPPEYAVFPIDESIYHETLQENWSKDFCLAFPTYADYEKNGLGFVARRLLDGKLVAGASSFTYYDEGIEVQIETHPDFQRKNLATVCGARLILECLNRNKYPSWDAANLISVHLAEKLGYHFDREYAAFHITRKPVS